MFIKRRQKMLMQIITLHALKVQLKGLHYNMKSQKMIRKRRNYSFMFMIKTYVTWKRKLKKYGNSVDVMFLNKARQSFTFNGNQMHDKCETLASEVFYCFMNKLSAMDTLHDKIIYFMRKGY